MSSATLAGRPSPLTPAAAVPRPAGAVKCLERDHAARPRIVSAFVLIGAGLCATCGATRLVAPCSARHPILFTPSRFAGALLSSHHRTPRGFAFRPSSRTAFRSVSRSVRQPDPILHPFHTSYDVSPARNAMELDSFHGGDMVVGSGSDGEVQSMQAAPRLRRCSINPALLKKLRPTTRHASRDYE